MSTVEVRSSLIWGLLGFAFLLGAALIGQIKRTSQLYEETVVLSTNLAHADSLLRECSQKDKNK